MINKKSLREVFEFFPNAKWITEDEDGEVNAWSEKPYAAHMEYPWGGHENIWCHDKYSIHPCDFEEVKYKIDWQHRKTWEERCVSRAEIMEGEGE